MNTLTKHLTIAVFCILWGLSPLVVVTPAPFNTIATVDGIVDSEWSPDELRDDDSDDDSGWDSDLNELKELYVTWDQERLYIGLVGYTEPFNAVHIVMDVDYGAGSGETNFSMGYAECRQNCRSMEEGFGAEFMYASDGMEDGELYELNWINNIEIQTGAMAAAHATEPRGYELAVRWDSLFGMGAGAVPEGCTMAVVAILGNAAGDYCSSETVPDWMNGSYMAGSLLFDRSCVITVDADGNGVPDDLLNTVLFLDDPTGDDYGPGSYEYPWDPIFSPGSFDLTFFEVSSTPQRVNFTVGISGEIENPWGSGAGFSLQNVDIYIDKDGIEGSGAQHTLDGRNASIAPNSAWEQMVWCAPSFDTFRSCIVDSSGSQDTSGVAVSVDTAQDRISISVAMEKIGEPDTAWSYIVLMLCQDGFSTGRVRPVNAEVSQWNFGGGDDGSFDANIIDMVVYPGLSQEGMLGNYDPQLGIRPVLYVRPDTTAPVIVHTPVDTAEEHLPILITAEIMDAVVSSASAFYRAPGESLYHESLMWGYFGNTWNGEIPGEAVTLEGVEYFLFATDGFNSSTWPSDTSSPHSVAVTPDVAPPVILDITAYPNPFSPNGDGYQDTTLLAWTLSEPAFVTISVYDSSLFLRRVVFQDRLCSSGENDAWWDGRDDGGEIVPDGTYPIRFEATDLSEHPAQPVEIPAVVDTTNRRTLDLMFLFHFNQNLVPYGKVANISCYVGLLETLRAHPDLKFLIHLSGSLIHDLLWFDDRAIRLVQEGVEDGQFEIIGSTYIQNVMYSTRVDSLDFQFNDKQIEQHRELIEKVFDVSPRGFWNPERTWTQNFVQLLADNGYEYVQVEDHILQESGITGSEYLVRTTKYKGRELTVFTDDKTFEGWVNYVIDSGDYGGLLDFLHQLFAEDSTDQYAVCYHEDAEATGLWDFEAGYDPHYNWDHLDSLLTLLENDPFLKVTTYGDWLQDHQVSEDVTPIVDGAALWMGGDDWFYENDSQTMNDYRAFFDGIRDRLNQVQGLIQSSGGDTTAASRLLKGAWNTLCAHQYEFGCHGLTEHEGFTDFELARCALVAAQAAEYALDTATATFQEDINDDAIDEVAMVTPSDLWVFSRHGGRLLYWFDLGRGEELVGNENFMYYGEGYVSDNRYVPAVQGGVDAYSWLSGNPIFPEIFQWTFQMRRRALNDWIEIDGHSIGELVHEPYDVAIQAGGVEFVYDGNQIQVCKIISPGQGGLIVSYRFYNKTRSPRSADFLVESGFCPSYFEVMDNGRGSLRYSDGQDTTFGVTSSTVGVTNMATGTMVLYRFDDEPTGLEGEEDVFGLELNPRYQFVIPPLDTYQVTFTLVDSAVSTEVEETSTPPPGGFSLLQNYPNPFNPQTSISFTLAREDKVTLGVYNILGQLVSILVDEKMAAGHHRLDWNASDLASGIYFCRLKAGDCSAIKKMTVIK